MHLIASNHKYATRCLVCILFLLLVSPRSGWDREGAHERESIFGGTTSQEHSVSFAPVYLHSTLSSPQLSKH